MLGYAWERRYKCLEPLGAPFSSLYFFQPQPPDSRESSVHWGVLVQRDQVLQGDLCFQPAQSQALHKGTGDWAGNCFGTESRGTKNLNTIVIGVNAHRQVPAYRECLETV